MFKLGGVDSLELKDGKVVDLDNKVKELQEAMPTYFKGADDQDKGKNDDPGKGGFKVLDNKLKGGADDGNQPTTLAERIAANMAKNEK